MWPASNPWQTWMAYADASGGAYAPQATWQAQRRRRLADLLVAARGSPLYRALLDRLGGPAARLADLPPTTKAQLRSGFARWVADPAVTLNALREHLREPQRIGEPFLGRYTVWESSGSSGEPMVFVQDAVAMATWDALEAARGPAAQIHPMAWLAGWQGLLRLAFVGAVDGHFASIVSLRRAARLNPWLGANLRCLSFLQPIDALVAQLAAWRPAVLATYPSMAWVLAQEQAAGRLRLELQAVWTGGETLTPGQRRAIEQAFGAPVRDSYGASECLTIAAECRCMRLHLHADWVILEPIDEHGNPVPPGEVGTTTLLTNLANRVQPVIRYELGDRVRYTGEACPCGSALPVIEVQGRRDDVLSLRARDGRIVHLAPLAVTTVLEEHAGVYDFVLVQRGPRELGLVLHGAAGSARRLDRARAMLAAWLATQGLTGVSIDARCEGTAVPLGRSGKTHRLLHEPRRLRVRAHPDGAAEGG